MKVAVITLSDRASKGIYEDLSGPKITEIIKEKYPDVNIRNIIIPDEKGELLDAMQLNSDSDFIITTGGTGISERDITPEVCREYCDKELPGISEIIRAESYKETPMAMLSRGFSGMKGKTIIVNFPGSVKAVTLCTKVLSQIMEHALKMIRGKGH